MTSDAKHLIDGFEALPDPAKREVLAELVRISRHIDYPQTSDDELIAAAEDVFLVYDEEERRSGSSTFGLTAKAPPALVGAAGHDRERAIDQA